MKRWPLNKAYFWETAPFFRALLPFVAGIVCYDLGWFAIQGANALEIICLTFLLYMSIAFVKRSNGIFLITPFLLLNIIMFFGGNAISYYNDVQNDKMWFGNSINTQNVYLARITDVPSEKEQSWKVSVRIISVIKEGKAAGVSGKAFLYLYKDSLMPMLLHEGDSILVPGKWQPIKNAGNPFEFDYATNCRRNDIYYQQSCSINNIHLYATNDPAAEGFIGKGHDWCMSQLDKYITDGKTKGLMQAMLLGDEVNLDEDLRQAYSDTGMVYIIAISGGHVAVLFFIIFSMLLWIRHKKYLWLKYMIALPMVWVYILIAGGSPSAIRSGVMFSLFAFSVMFQKDNNSLNRLFTTAFLLLCFQPEWLFATGFQLAFVAVLSLILFYKRIYMWLSPVNKIVRFFWSAIVASIAAEILLAPLVIYYFHTFPLLFVVANVAAYLFMCLMLVLGMAIIALSSFAPIAHFIGTCTVWIVTIFDKMVVWLQGFNPASFHFLVLKNVEFLLVYFMIAGMSLFFIKKRKTALFMGMAAACLLLISFCKDEWIRQQQQRLVIFNTAKDNQIELINGNTYTVLNTDTAALKKIAYTAKPAHTSWGTWHETHNAGSEIINIHGKTVLLLNCSVDTATHFPVNYLFVNNPEETDPVKLEKIFSPSMIIIGNRYSQEQANKFVKVCAMNNIVVHVIANEGAFVVN